MTETDKRKSKDQIILCETSTDVLLDKTIITEYNYNYGHDT